ncbi:pyruvate dehydrogenase (acetyl-transferring) E1 component subunit alpha [Actinomadura spongiicola]|uniref:Pyruvate dehydrogenase (Acetyl-transferring) E1 component subunit alpha n=1 Tax=Actinomadura spongiicola TaxID=2303421 RepID=A0A372GNI0_9ACTN|nr:pyruvate dehydrogenase (acetyl-transferring) E1 component subunit alpha [Actinomadura spongiicola]RFS86613.1 pyruvate dehydrogenase (acetyl-transferring) E1 component subunit alpha [Actinomadura spongiicola]
MSPHDEPGRPGDGDLVRLLTPDGERVEHPDYDLDLSKSQYRALYRDMRLVRRVDTEAVALQRQGELGMWIPCEGQEGAQVGSAHALRPDDHVFPSYREQGVAWCRGIAPLTLMGMLRGVSNGGWDPERNGFHLYTIVIGTQTLHAVGYAMGMRRDGADAAVLAYFGDGATSQGDVNEAFNFAAVFRAPVVFFCQNNQWAISVPNDRQTRAPLYRRAAGFGFPGIRVDGNDVLACLAVTRDALAGARRGEGPVLVEALTYRMGPHTTSDDPSRYRSEEDVDYWRARDPISRMRAYLTREGMADDAFFREVEEEGDRIAAELREGVRAMPDPPVEAIFDHVYAAPHPLLAEERAQHLRYLDGFADE